MSYKFYEETRFKDSEIGPIPKDWQVVRLGEVAEIKYGKANPEIPGPYPLIGSGGIYGYVGKCLIEKPTIIIGRKGTAGEVYLSNSPCYPSDTTFYLDLQNTSIYIKYLYFYMTKNKISGEHAKTTLPSLQRTDLQKFPILLPPLSEQKAIAEVLSIIQEAKEKTEAVIKATRELKKSLMKHLFTYGPVPLSETDKVKLKETEIGLIPEHWQVVRLGEVCEKTKQIDPSKKSDLTFKYIDVSSINNELLKITNHQLHTSKNAPSRARKIIKTGDIIFATVRPYLKRIALVTPEYNNQICSSAFCVLRSNNKFIHTTFLFYAVSSDQFVKSVSEGQRGTSYPAITDKDVKSGLIPLPPLHEQQAIADILQAIDEKIQKEESKKQAIEKLFKSMLNKLMRGEIRIEINKESAL